MALRGELMEVSGLSTHYLDQGRGRPILLIHGLGSSGYLEWRFNASRLARRHRVLVPDLPGYGRSAKPRQHRYSMAFFCEFLLQFLDAVGLNRVDVVGASMGGRIALEMALVAPQRLRSLTLVNSLGFGRPGLLSAPGYGLMMLPRVGEWVLDAAHRVHAQLDLGRAQQVHGLRLYDRRRARRLHDQEAHDYIRELISDPDYRDSYLATVRGFADRWKVRQGINVSDRLAEISTPTLLVWGRHDLIFPLSHARTARAGIPNSRLEIFDDCRHSPQQEKPELFNRTLLDFLSTV